MYIGKLTDVPEFRLIDEVTICDLSKSLEIGKMSKLILEQGYEYRYLLDSFGKAIENIIHHGSDNCVFYIGRTTSQDLILLVQDPYQGFDITTIGKPINNPGGEGYKCYKETKATVGHSIDGSVTYILSNNN